MVGRHSVVGSCIVGSCLLLAGAGCTALKGNKSPMQAAQVAPPPPTVPVDTTPKDDGKRGPRVAIAMAGFKEAEARQLDRNPETQYKVRDQARLLYQEAVKLDPGNIEAHRGLARVYVDLGEFPRAAETLKKAQAKFPKDPVFWFEQGQMHNRKREFAEAVKAYHKALEIDPENRACLTSLGFTLARMGQIEQSVATLSRSMGPASAHYNVARMLVHLERSRDAVPHLRKALEYNPNLESARQMLAQLEDGGGGIPTASLELDGLR